MNKLDIILAYTNSTNLVEKDAFAFLVNNRRSIVDALGYNAFKEMTINYRTYFKRNQKDKIVYNFKKYIIGKSAEHHSDLAIGYNIIKFVNVDSASESTILDYLYTRLSVPLSKKYKNLSAISARQQLKKSIVLEYIEKNILIKKRK
jgi:hypothetical protein